MTAAYTLQVRGVVQGVGFRPFVYRLARANGLTGWVSNVEDGAEIHLEGEEPALHFFLDQLKIGPPPAASITSLHVASTALIGCSEFVIRASQDQLQPTTPVAPDLPICERCLQELFDPGDCRYHYPYTNCMNCGPRYTVIRNLPYDRANTTMSGWPLDSFCASQYGDPRNRRFHAQPVACPQCGPHYTFQVSNK